MGPEPINLKSSTYNDNAEGQMGPERSSAPKTQAPEGRYANYFKIGHNAFEFVLDFGQYYHESEKAELYTRIVTSPSYAKDLLNTLKDSIVQHEKIFGPIAKSS
jgi:hypothetical protein